MARKVYIETSVISYLTVRPSNDSIKLACLQITRLWWDAGRSSVSTFISPYVVEEASAGDPLAAYERIMNASRHCVRFPYCPLRLKLWSWLNFSCSAAVYLQRPGSMLCTSPARRITESMFY